MIVIWRGGEKKWFHVKRGVPIRLEIGPRDIEKDQLFMGRRDQAKSVGIERQAFVQQVPQLLDEIQQGLYDRALAMRQEHTREIDTLDDFKAFFQPKNSQQPEIHGGFASCHFHESPEVEEMLKELKVTVRCMPLGEGNLPQAAEPGTCIFTGKESKGRAIFAKSY